MLSVTLLRSVFWQPFFFLFWNKRFIIRNILYTIVGEVGEITDRKWVRVSEKGHSPALLCGNNPELVGVCRSQSWPAAVMGPWRGHGRGLNGSCGLCIAITCLFTDKHLEMGLGQLLVRSQEGLDREQRKVTPGTCWTHLCLSFTIFNCKGFQRIIPDHHSRQGSHGNTSVTPSSNVTTLIICSIIVDFLIFLHH